MAAAAAGAGLASSDQAAGARALLSELVRLAGCRFWWSAESQGRGPRREMAATASNRHIATAGQKTVGIYSHIYLALPTGDAARRHAADKPWQPAMDASLVLALDSKISLHLY